MPNINFFDTYYMAGMIEEIVPQQTFFRDRYFPTPRVFDNDKVLVEYMDGDRKMAPFIAPRVGDIPVDRAGYELYEFTPPMVAPSRVLTIDELRKRGFGETMEANKLPHCSPERERLPIPRSSFCLGGMSPCSTTSKFVVSSRSAFVSKIPIS